MPDGALPVPAIMGGAVETLMTMLVEQNEINPQFEFHFIMSKTKNEKQVKNIFKHTILHQIKTSMFARKIENIFHSINWRCNYKLPLCTTYHSKIFKLIKNLQPDIIIYENGVDSSLKQIAKQFSATKILHIHNQFIMKREIDNNIQNIISVSKFMKTDWLNTCPNANVQVLPNAINEKYFNMSNITQQQKLDLRQKLGIQPTDFVVLYTGRIIPVKGVLELVKAVDELQDKTIKLVLVGATFFERKMKPTLYQKQIQQTMQGNPNIIATGHIPYEQLGQYYAITNAQVVPSLWEEASGMVAIEGNYCGLPQIITNSGGLPENVSSSAIIIDKNKDVVSQLKEAIVKVKNKKITNSRDVKALTAKDYFNEFVKIINKFEENNGEN